MLTEDGQNAKDLVVRLLKRVSICAGREIYAKMSFENDIYEGHVIDSGKCVWNGDEPSLSSDGEEIGMIFFGGFYDAKEHDDAESLAWISLLKDIIGQCEDLFIRESHNLTKALELHGPRLNVNFNSVSDLKRYLDNLEREYV